MLQFKADTTKKDIFKFLVMDMRFKEEHTLIINKLYTDEKNKIQQLSTLTDIEVLHCFFLLFETVCISVQLNCNSQLILLP